MPRLNVEFLEDVDDNGHGHDHDPSIGGLARMTLEDALDWNEFKQLLSDPIIGGLARNDPRGIHSIGKSSSNCDLFLWHREAYLGDDGILDLENEERYEKSFIEGAKKRIFQDGSKNVKKTEHKRK
ncbi:hypothetical protein BGZ65_003549 [Modicella reniformis]|uniref:Uncharacterized protein n=1 Tax=Modicella reniformis TaxID=1440133 RepID=A0A9P6MIH4_9FUNG|nr:hypothetical protein BGZ65_003549 [Modicella reniformis]